MLKKENEMEGRRQGKEKGRPTDCQGKNELSWLQDKMIVYVKNPNESRKRKRSWT
jgi:hypothetical protein